MVSLQGIFYTGAVIMLVVLLTLYVTSYLGALRTQGESVTIKIRANEMANFVESLSLDMPRVVEISTKRALVAAVNEVDLRGAGLDDAQYRIKELVINGTLYGVPSYWLNASTVPNWAARVSAIGARKGFTTNFTFEEYDIEPYDAFSLRARLSWGVNVSDSILSMKVRRTYTTSVIISIINQDDPLYPIHTRGLVQRKIVPSNFTPHNVTSLNRFINDKTYVINEDAPSFLDRLEDNFIVPSRYNLMTNNTIGIESMVNMYELLSYGVETEANKTSVDHLYFAPIFFQGYPVNGSSYDWLRLDEEHAEFYGVNGSLIYT